MPSCTQTRNLPLTESILLSAVQSYVGLVLFPDAFALGGHFILGGEGTTGAALARASSTPAMFSRCICGLCRVSWGERRGGDPYPPNIKWPPRADGSGYETNVGWPRATLAKCDKDRGLMGDMKVVGAYTIQVYTFLPPHMHPHTPSLPSPPLTRCKAL